MIYPFTAVFLILLAASTYEIIKQLSFENRKNTILIISAAALLFTAVSVHLHYRVLALIKPVKGREYIENCMVKITDVKERRYSRGIDFITEGPDSTPQKGSLNYRGTRHLRPGGHMVIHRRIKQIPKNSPSGFTVRLKRRGIKYSGFAEDKDITVTEASPPTLREEMRRSLLKRTDRLFNHRTASILKALYTGNKSRIDKRTLINFRDAGVLHVLAASGLHVGIIAAIPLLLLIFPLTRKSVTSVSLILVILYLYITDAPVSLMRASIMFSLFYFQSLLDRERNILNILMLTGSCILILHPWEIFNPGFQLSFGATTGILVFYKQYKSSLTGLPGPVRNSFALTLSAQVLTIPCIFYHLEQINLIGLISNLLIIPLISLLLILSLLSLALSCLSLTAGLAGGAGVDLLCALISKTADTGAAAGLNFHTGQITIPLLVFYTLSLVPLIKTGAVKKIKYYPVAAALLLALLYLKGPVSDKKLYSSLLPYQSMAEIISSDEKKLLRVNFKKIGDTAGFTDVLKKSNIRINSMEVKNCSFANILACREIISNFTIDECIIPEKIIGTGNLTELLRMTSIDGISVTVEKKH